MTADGGKAMDKDGFYTLKGYSLTEDSGITPAMEDYLEMITRIEKEKGDVRVHELAARLHVQKSSVSKMIHILSRTGYLTAARYGDIRPTAAGRAVGERLLHRHTVVERFLSLLNGEEESLEEAEKIEHFLSEKTLRSMEAFLASEKRNPRCTETAAAVLSGKIGMRETESRCESGIGKNNNTNVRCGKYRCGCGYIYDEETGCPQRNIAPGTRFCDLPDGFACPLCGIGKAGFLREAVCDGKRHSENTGYSG